jgi:hypothetical protein
MLPTTMNYHLARSGNRYGPYTLENLRTMQAQGNILPDDLLWAEGWPNWVPATQVLQQAAPQPAPQAPPQAAAPQPSYGAPAGGGYAPQASPYGQQPSPYAPGGMGAAPQPGGSPMPPNLHWALVLLLGIVTCGLFSLIWFFIQAGYSKKIDPTSNATALLAIGLVMDVGGIAIGFALMAATQRAELSIIGNLISLASVVLMLMAVFRIRRAMLMYFNGTENIGLRLSGVMTFFFTCLYLQYHMSRIAQWKQTGVLTPQG